MKGLKILGFAGALVAAAVVGGTLINAVSANPGGSSSLDPLAATSSNAPGEYCQTFLSEFARQLGVPESALAPAAKAAADAAIDQAVTNGDLPKAIGDQLKQRIASANGNGCAMIGARWGAALRHVVRQDIVGDMAQAAASALRLSVADLRSKLAAGESLKQIAADQKVDYATVTSAVHDAAKADLDKLVSAGRLTQDRENAILSALDKALANGRIGGGKIRPFAGPMRRGPFAPAPASPGASPAAPSSSSGSSS